MYKNFTFSCWTLLYHCHSFWFSMFRSPQYSIFAVVNYLLKNGKMRIQYKASSVFAFTLLSFYSSLLRSKFPFRELSTRGNFFLHNTILPVCSNLFFWSSEAVYTVLLETESRVSFSTFKMLYDYHLTYQVHDHYEVILFLFLYSSFFFGFFKKYLQVPCLFVCIYHSWY